MGKLLDTREAEFAFVDRFVLFFNPNRFEGQTKPVLVTEYQEQEYIDIENYIETITNEDGTIQDIEKTREITKTKTIPIQVEKQEPMGECSINLTIRYELQDINKSVLKYEEVEHNLYRGENNKTVSQILQLVGDQVYGYIAQDKQDLTGFISNM